MIKGNVAKERDTILRPNVNYRKLSALNASMLKLFDSDPVKFFEQFKMGKKRKDNKSPSVIMGDIVDFYLLDCKGNEEEFDERFEEKFSLFEGVRGSGQVFHLADELFEITQQYVNDEGEVTVSFDTRFTEAFNKVKAAGKYSGKTEDKALEDFNKNGYDYFKCLLDNIGKVVVDVSLLDKSKRIATLLMNDPFTKDVFKDNDDEEYFPKFPIEWEYVTKQGVKTLCKSELDIIRINHTKKTIYLQDLKTCFDNESFEYGYLKYRYDIQAAFYYLAIQYWAKQEGMTDYTIIPMEFIVGDTSSNNRRPVRYQTTLEDLKASLEGFKINNSYKGVTQIMEEIAWAESTDNWNISKTAYENDGIMKLNLDYKQ